MLSEQAAGFIDAALGPSLNNPQVSTPADFGMEAADVEFQTADGATLRDWLIRGGTDKIAIQSHFVTGNHSGGQEGASLLSKTAKAFHDAGYTFLLFDARNHGTSDKGPIPYAMGTQQDSPDYVAAVEFVTSLPGFF